MRPKSIVLFERLYWLAAVLAVINSLAAWPKVVKQLTAQPGFAEMSDGFFMAMLGGVIVGGLAFNVLFWFLIARRANNVMRWIWTVLALLSVPGVLINIVKWISSGIDSPLTTVLILVIFAANMTALVLLFRPDSRDWFATGGKTPTATVFD